MKLYIANGQYVGTQAEAKRLDRDYEQVDFPTDKDGMIAALNNILMNERLPQPTGYTDETDGGVTLTYDKPSYTEQSVDIDERFNQLPLAHQLSLAALALERARYQLPVRSPKGQKVIDSAAEMLSQPNPILDGLLD